MKNKKTQKIIKNTSQESIPIFQNPFRNVKNPYMRLDSDRDRVPDLKDCAPFNPHEHGVAWDWMKGKVITPIYRPIYQKIYKPVVEPTITTAQKAAQRAIEQLKPTIAYDYKKAAEQRAVEIEKLKRKKEKFIEKIEKKIPEKIAIPQITKPSVVAERIGAVVAPTVPKVKEKVGVYIRPKEERERLIKEAKEIPSKLGIYVRPKEERERLVREAKEIVTRPVEAWKAKYEKVLGVPAPSLKPKIPKPVIGERIKEITEWRPESVKKLKTDETEMIIAQKDYDQKFSELNNVTKRYDSYIKTINGEQIFTTDDVEAVENKWRNKIVGNEFIGTEEEYYNSYLPEYESAENRENDLYSRYNTDITKAYDDVTVASEILNSKIEQYNQQKALVSSTGYYVEKAFERGKVPTKYVSEEEYMKTVESRKGITIPLTGTFVKEDGEWIRYYPKEITKTIPSGLGILGERVVMPGLAKIDPKEYNLMNNWNKQSKDLITLDEEYKRQGLIDPVTNKFLGTQAQADAFNQKVGEYNKAKTNYEYYNPHIARQIAKGTFEGATYAAAFLVPGLNYILGAEFISQVATKPIETGKGFYEVGKREPYRLGAMITTMATFPVKKTGELKFPTKVERVVEKAGKEPPVIEGGKLLKSEELGTTGIYRFTFEVPSEVRVSGIYLKEPTITPLKYKGIKPLVGVEYGVGRVIPKPFVGKPTLKVEPFLPGSAVETAYALRGLLKTNPEAAPVIMASLQAVEAMSGRPVSFFKGKIDISYSEAIPKEALRTINRLLEQERVLFHGSLAQRVQMIMFRRLHDIDITLRKGRNSYEFAKLLEETLNKEVPGHRWTISPKEVPKGKRLDDPYKHEGWNLEVDGGHAMCIHGYKYFDKSALQLGFKGERTLLKGVKLGEVETAIARLETITKVKGVSSIGQLLRMQLTGGPRIKDIADFLGALRTKQVMLSFYKDNPFVGRIARMKIAQIEEALNLWKPYIKKHWVELSKGSKYQLTYEEFMRQAFQPGLENILKSKITKPPFKEPIFEPILKEKPPLERPPKVEKLPTKEPVVSPFGLSPEVQTAVGSYLGYLGMRKVEPIKPSIPTKPSPEILKLNEAYSSYMSNVKSSVGASPVSSDIKSYISQVSKPSILRPSVPTKPSPPSKVFPSQRYISKYITGIPSKPIVPYKVPPRPSYLLPSQYISKYISPLIPPPSKPSPYKPPYKPVYAPPYVPPYKPVEYPPYVPPPYEPIKYPPFPPLISVPPPPPPLLPPLIYKPPKEEKPKKAKKPKKPEYYPYAEITPILEPSQILGHFTGQKLTVVKKPIQKKKPKDKDFILQQLGVKT